MEREDGKEGAEGGGRKVAVEAKKAWVGWWPDGDASVPRSGGASDAARRGADLMNHPWTFGHLDIWTLTLIATFGFCDAERFEMAFRSAEGK